MQMFADHVQLMASMGPDLKNKCTREGIPIA